MIRSFQVFGSIACHPGRSMGVSESCSEINGWVCEGVEKEFNRGWSVSKGVVGY